MDIVERKLSGVYEITLKPHRDSRGYFMRTYDKNQFAAASLDKEWVQENHSLSLKKGIIRGLHFQLPPFSETKLVRCTRGRIQDVFVDLRSGSKTFGQWESIELAEDNYKMILIPRGFAHGFCTLEENCEVLYKVDNYYSPQHENGLIWNDPELSINWLITDPVLSEKDQRNLTFKEFTIKYKMLKA